MIFYNKNDVKKSEQNYMLDNMDEEYHSASEDTEIEPLKIYNEENIISKYNENITLHTLGFRDFVKYSEPWQYNRKINDETVDELYKVLQEPDGSSIPWMFHAILDEKEDKNKLYIIDGQHKRKAIELYIENYDEDMTCERKICCWIYKIEDSSTTNRTKAVELFKKINNNRNFEEEDLPNNRSMDIIELLKKKKSLETGITKNKSYVPRISTQELNILLNQNLKSFEKLSIEEVANNIQKINHKLSLKTTSELYGRKKTFETQYNKANKIKFYLNLKGSKYGPEIWINYISKVEEL